MTVSALHITSEHARQFREEGFFVLERTVPPSDLDTLRGECQRFIDERDREIDFGALATVTVSLPTSSPATRSNMTSIASLRFIRKAAIASRRRSGGTSARTQTRVLVATIQ